MVLMHTPVCDFDLACPDFELPGVDGQLHSKQSCMGELGLLVMFICNHCPYVKAIQARLVRDAKTLIENGVGVVAISANDPNDYPEDSFESMQRVAEVEGYPFPYLFDESQAVAKSFDAICTPDFFGYNAEGGLQYRGRLDESGREPAAADVRRELVEAMLQVAETGKGPAEQTPSMGCSIKWKSQ
ncbi:MAG: thioredoxin family protein [Gammaproteobacteria bacterium]|nr:thioredoxin family protein [Gammaproteobacteria bacterium]